MITTALFLPLSGCFHAVVETGRPVSTNVIQIDWANGYLWGLIPPDKVETAARCPSGVALVETQHSFLNMLAGALTFGIYAPMTITVTCAARPSAAVPVITVPGDPLTALSKGVEMATRIGEAVYVGY